MLTGFSCQGDDDAAVCTFFVANVERAMHIYSTRCPNMQTVSTFGQQVRIYFLDFSSSECLYLLPGNYLANLLLEGTGSIQL
jgi:hypothetical protein